MSKDKISDYSTTANSNTDIGGINVDEGCAPSGINDAIRTLMAQLKTWQSGGQDVYIHPAGSASAPSITANGDTNTGIFFPAADTVGIATGGTERARVDSSGNLGVGTTSPSAQLHIVGSDTTDQVIIENTDAGAATAPDITLYRNSASPAANDALGQIFFKGNDSGGTSTTYAGIAAYITDPTDTSEYAFLQFATTGAGSFAERMRITSTGEVLVGGDTEIHSASGGITVQRSNASPSLYLFRNDTTVGTGDVLGSLAYYGNDTTSNTPTQLVYINAVSLGAHGAGDNPTELAFGTTPDNTSTVTEAVRIKAGGGLQISRTDVTAPATGDGNVFSGTYTPTLTNTTNITASTAVTCQYMRVGNTVTVSGQVSGITMTAAAATSTVLKMTLPIASALGSTRQVGGTAVFYSSASRGTAVAIYGDATNDIAEFNWAAPTTTASQAFTFSFTYLVQ
jgi:hypothetical protein